MSAKQVTSLTLADRIRHARRVSVPLLAITTSDQNACQRLLVDLYSEKAPIVRWDIVAGTRALNAAGRSVENMCQIGGDDATKGAPANLLALAAQFPDDSIVIAHNWDQYLEAKGAPTILQGMANLRDDYKGSRRMLVVLAPSLTLPAALKDDIVLIDEPLPEADELRLIIQEQDKAACDGAKGRASLTPADTDRAVEAVMGLPRFGAETSVAMALRKTGIDLDHLWEAKRAIISQVPGLSVDRGTETFDDIGGLRNIIEFGKRLANGKRRPRCIVRVEELEKALGGAGGGDLSGTSSYILQVLLSSMEDYGWGGLLAFGPAGSGKSLFAKTMANSFGMLPLVLDVNATKASLVGQSEQQIRAAIKTLLAIGGRDVFFVASVNSIASLRPELLRRYRHGIWMFDTPDGEERKLIWDVQRAKFDIPASDPGVVDDEGWSGADIRNACELAYSFDSTIEEALPYLTQNGRVNPTQIKECRAQAEGRYLSASYPGVYSANREKVSSSGRAVSFDE